jgi:hypothetical protein
MVKRAKRISAASEHLQGADMERLKLEIIEAEEKEGLIIEDEVVAIGDNVEDHSFRSQDNSDASLFGGDMSNKNAKKNRRGSRRKSHFIDYIRLMSNKNHNNQEA